jgi:hypothetical protein
MVTPVRRTSRETFSSDLAIFPAMIARGAGVVDTLHSTVAFSERSDQDALSTRKTHRSDRPPPPLGSSRPSTYAGGKGAALS